jgi:hypothetical protein
MKNMYVLLLVFLLAGCSYSQIAYQPKTDIDRTEAIAIIEQVLLEDYNAQLRPVEVRVGNEFIELHDGLVSKGSTIGSAVAVGYGAIGASNSTTVTRAAGQRIYFSSLGTSTLHSKRMRDNRHVILVRNREDIVLRKVRTTNLSRAHRFLDALAYLASSAGTSR